MPVISADKTEADFDRYAGAAETFAALRKEYLAALGRQPGGAVQVALIKLKGVRDSADVLFPNAEQPSVTVESDWGAEAQGMEAACEKLRAKIDALPAPAESGASPGGAAGAKELATKAGAFRTRLKALEAEAAQAAETVTKAEAAAQGVAERGRALLAEVNQEIAAAQTKVGHDPRAH
jgi:hypothetical protein